MVLPDLDGVTGRRKARKVSLTAPFATDGDGAHRFAGADLPTTETNPAETEPEMGGYLCVSHTDLFIHMRGRV